MRSEKQRIAETESLFREVNERIAETAEGFDADEASYRQVRGRYRIDPDTMALLRHDAVVMHPLPRVDEIHPAVDSDHRALSETRDVSEEWALLAVQGPEALQRLGVDVEPFAFREDAVLGIRCVVAGTGYTGERGCELGCDPDDAPALWDRILERGVVPCGLGARDTLRLEMCYPLHGNDITPERTPIEAGLGWACALDKEFTGVDVLRRQKEDGPAEKLVAFVMEDKGIPRQGMGIEEGGEVTSGTFSPTLKRGIGMGYVDAGLAEPDTKLTIDIRGRPQLAREVKKPIYKREEG